MEDNDDNALQLLPMVKRRQLEKQYGKQRRGRAAAAAAVAGESLRSRSDSDSDVQLVQEVAAARQRRCSGGTTNGVAAMPAIRRQPRPSPGSEALALAQQQLEELRREAAAPLEDDELSLLDSQGGWV